MREIFFVTGNYHKFKEISSIFRDSLRSIKIKRVKLRKVEIQSDSLEKIAQFAAEWIINHTNFREPFIIEDAGLFIDELRGFPGPYSHYVYKTIGINGILELMRTSENRNALFKSAIAFWDGNKIVVFSGQVEGTISLEPRGTFGFGFDPIFIPQNTNKTFAEMKMQEKNLYSHRAKATKKLIEYIASNLFLPESTDSTG